MCYKRLISKALLFLLTLPILLFLVVLPTAAEDAADAVTFRYTGSGIQVTGNGGGYNVSGTQINIDEGGIYRITGICPNGGIRVGAGVTGVTLLLQNLSLSSSDPPLCCLDGSSVHCLISDTVSLSGEALSVGSDAELVIEGSGSLKIGAASALHVNCGGTLLAADSAVSACLPVSGTYVLFDCAAPLTEEAEASLQPQSAGGQAAGQSEALPATVAGELSPEMGTISPAGSIAPGQEGHVLLPGAGENSLVPVPASEAGTTPPVSAGSTVSILSSGTEHFRTDLLTGSSRLLFVSANLQPGTVCTLRSGDTAAAVGTAVVDSLSLNAATGSTENSTVSAPQPVAFPSAADAGTQMGYPGSSVPLRVAAADVPSKWAVYEIRRAYDEGLVSADLLKHYQRPVNRGAVAGMFIRLLEKASGWTIENYLRGKGVTPDQNAFLDSHDPDVLAANALGIIQGTGGGLFTPYKPLSRAELAAVLNRTAERLGADTAACSHSFTDVAGHWVDGELGWACAHGVIQGRGGGRFDPDSPVTTQEAIVISYRALCALK